MTNLEVVDDGADVRAGGHRRSWQPFLLLPLLVLLPVSFLVLLSGFDGLYGQDAFAYFDYATGPLREALRRGDPLPPFFWPPGYPLLVLATSLFLGSQPLAGQLVSLFTGALVPLFTALLAREALERHDLRSPLSCPWVPLLAGLLIAVTGQLWQSSAVVMSDTTALAAATFGVWALLRYERNGVGRWLWLAAVGLAYALLTRWSYAVVALPCTLYALYLLARQPRGKSLWHAVVAAFLVLAVLSPVLLSSWQQAQETSLGDESFAGNFNVYTWHPLNALRREHITRDGVLHFRYPNGLYYALLPAHRYFFTPLLALLLLPGAVVFWRHRQNPALYVIAGWLLVAYLLLAGGAYQNIRHAVPTLPPLAIFMALGADGLARIPAVEARRPLLAVVLTGGLLWMVHGGWTLTGDFIERKQADLATVHWVEEQAEPEAQLITFNMTLTFQHYSHLETHELFFLDAGKMAALLAEGEPVYLLLDVGNVQSQWVGLSPAVNYAWLRNEPGLVTLGKHRQYTLYRVQQGALGG